ncbi:hypothetical protein D3C76_1039760 [compost metagenome]
MAQAQDQANDAGQQHPPGLLHEVRQGDHPLGEQRQLGTKAFEQTLKLRHHLHQQNARHQRRHQQHDHRVGHGLLDPRLEPFGLFLVGGDPVQQRIQSAGLLARIDQVAIEFIEMPRLVAHRRGKAAAPRHILLELAHQRAHVRVVEAFGDDVEGLQHGYAGFHHGRHLPGEQGDIGGLDAFTRAQ